MCSSPVPGLSRIVSPVPRTPAAPCPATPTVEEVDPALDSDCVSHLQPRLSRASGHHCVVPHVCSYRYESSGYEYTSAPSPQTYTTYRQVYTSPPHNVSLHQSNQSYSEPDTSANQDNTIESGPSFSESLSRFKTASGQNAQVASWKSSRQHSSSSSHVQRRVEETRTMITQSSQKSYHIE